ncbi:semaphorin-2A-like isoform X2 [Ostrea edulis]|uniref:semaphorin-2A-like isoform X2 n=1 Tax=Ostrea edulis TaxID=37623 RepID=UPI0024AF29E6|nr:semaphorin-2A-like isoform X2 [Ostrea edulis]XP_056022534.1 semaphorin-2A-like isoform X2 [Ostrea edulis]XP_056022535.1 semaphorin-2A-like isoform X2 [Ostrea edulis]XP_056022536.1 semaphorin-2A-like isoform X2 [Ostrea edulis]XP_056022537.1 semaphorin-2A-like isoform X2 [Ostrea edulis]XP_056022539.1 semaphorin-2A-like isoform X2 [Ostrea edulis]XP_056022540.1 semaphorin-2A-like isoform X2 [Ostrea edulis]XP_056022541.1 semaphorin-2A-like isoform X2 [Ostrea edulis]XP_056022542.1 semaphorin-2
MAVPLSVKGGMDFMLKISSLFFFMVYGQAQYSNRFLEKDLNINTFQNESTRNYSFLYIDNSTGTLFVGARNRLIQLSLDNISDSSQLRSKSIMASKSNQVLCKFNGKSEEYCQNYIKYIVRVDNSTLYFCGTDANTPSEYTATVNGNDLVISSPKKATACPRDPKDNTTAVYVTSGNPNNHAALYSATILDNGKATISRPALPGGIDKLENADPIRWLNEPQFVASFDVDEDVYFFFREIALEYSDFMKKTVSRVARVCKKDLGGSSLLVNKWTTYQKARLNCSLPGSFPFYFDEIQDVQLVNNTFYGLFISSVNGSSGSAICAFTVSSVKDRFADKVYKFRETPTSIWTPLPASKIPKDSDPGKCIDDSKSLKDVEENFMMEYPLKDSPVQQNGGKPLVFVNGIQMHVLQVDKERSRQGGSLILYAASNTGEVYKIHSWSNGKKHALSTVFSPLPKSEVIWDMKFFNDMLYISTDSAVKQFPVIICDKYVKIDACLHDPYCTWKKTQSLFSGSCAVRKPSDNQYTHEDIPRLMKSYNASMHNKTKRDVGVGQSTTLPHNYPFTLDGKKVTWYKMMLSNEGNKKAQVQLDNNNMMNSNQDLILSRVYDKDQGVYEAYYEDEKLSTVEVKLMQTNDDMEKAWKARFTEWCEEFDRIKKMSYSNQC